MPSVRVARIITRLNVGGPSIQAVTLSERLNERGFETLLVHGQLGPGEGDMRYLLTDQNVAVRSVPALQRAVAPVRDIQALAQIYRLLRRFKPAIVHTHMAKAGTLGRLAAAAYNRSAGRGRRARVLHTYHGHVLEGYFSSAAARLFVQTERLLASATDAIVAIAPTVRDELLQRYHIGRPEQYPILPAGSQPAAFAALRASARQAARNAPGFSAGGAGPYRIVRPGFELSAFAAIDDAARQAARNALDIPAGAPVITTVGRLTAIKQHQLFLDTAALVTARHPTAVFLIVGDGELRSDLERAAADLNLSTRVRFLGWRRDLTTIYGATDVFLLTSRNEGTPVALIESLAAAVPGVSTNVGGVSDVIADADVSLLAPFGDARALAAHVSTLIEDPVRRHAMGERGRAHVLARYSLSRLVNDIDALYRELLA